jgi:glycosyltransferase involved in cell wall biosynthesis
MKVISHMASGNGAYVVHRILKDNLSFYDLHGYSPYVELFPPAFYLFALKKCKEAYITHVTPDYGCFFYSPKSPMVVTFHNYVLDSAARDFTSPAQRLHYKTDLRYFTKKSLSLASVVTSVSQFTANLVKKDLGYKNDVKVIYNGVDTDSFRPNKRQPRKTIRVLFSGNLTKRKGAHLLPLIAEGLDDGIEILYTVGLRSNNCIPSHPKLVNLGSVKFVDMPAIYQQADMLLFPTFREGFGLAAAEAMSCGIPVVATNASSLPELVVHGHGGYLCEPGNVIDFAEKINLLASSPNLRQSMGGFNRERVLKKFSVRRMVRDYKALFENLQFC